MKTLKLAAVCATTLLTGCASIVGGTNQVVSVETRDKGKQVAGATCQLTNEKGTYFVTTPGTVTIRRAYDDMNVKCEKDEYQPGIAAVKSSTKGMAFGNILFGGFIGAGVDMASGAAYDYPPLITVMMGEAITITPPSPKKEEELGEATPAPAATDTAKAATPASIE
jgi:hypothetical protein